MNRACVAVGWMLLSACAARSAEESPTMDLIGRSRYAEIGRVVFDTDFRREMLEIGGRRIFTNARVGSESQVASPFSRTECVYYVAEEVEDLGPEGMRTLRYEESENKFWIEVAGHRILADRLALREAYRDAGDGVNLLGPIESWEGERIRRREWCLVPGRDYWLAIFVVSSTVPPGPGGRVEYASSYRFHLTDQRNKR